MADLLEAMQDRGLFFATERVANVAVRRVSNLGPAGSAYAAVAPPASSGISQYWLDRWLLAVSPVQSSVLLALLQIASRPRWAISEAGGPISVQYVAGLAGVDRKTLQRLSLERFEPASIWAAVLAIDERAGRAPDWSILYDPPIHPDDLRLFDRLINLRHSDAGKGVTCDLESQDLRHCDAGSPPPYHPLIPKSISNTPEGSMTRNEVVAELVRLGMEPAGAELLLATEEHTYWARKWITVDPLCGKSWLECARVNSPSRFLRATVMKAATGQRTAQMAPQAWQDARAEAILQRDAERLKARGPIRIAEPAPAPIRQQPVEPRHREFLNALLAGAGPAYGAVLSQVGVEDHNGSPRLLLTTRTEAGVLQRLRLDVAWRIVGHD